MISKALLITGWVMVIVYALVTLPVTMLVFRPTEVNLSEGEVTLVRTFPMDKYGFPRPRMAYVETVAPLTQAHNNGKICQDSRNAFPYSAKMNTGVWSINDWAHDCLTDPIGVIWSATWTWHLGSLMLGPTSFDKTFFSPTLYDRP